MTINELIVQLIHTGMQHSFNLDISINDWDRHQSTLEGMIDDGCLDCVGTGLALDDPIWQQELIMIRSWLEAVMTEDKYKEVERVLILTWNPLMNVAE